MTSGVRAEIIEAGLLTTRLGTLGAVVELARPFTHDELCGALTRLLRVFPVLDTRYEARLWRDRWAPAAQPVEAAFRWLAPADLEAATQAAVGEPLDPVLERPVRLTALNAGGGQRLVLVMPHLVADGAGALATLHELLAQLAGTGFAAPPPMNRGLLQLGAGIGLRRWPQALREFLREARRLVDVPRLSVWAARFTPAPAPTQAWSRIFVDEAASAAFAAQCKALGATVNDGLIAAALAVVAKRQPAGRAGVAYTINLRRFLPPRPIVANVSGFTMVALPVAETRDLATSIPKVAAVTGEHKEGLPGVGSVLFPLGLFGWWGHGLAHVFGHFFRWVMVRQGERMAVMTNVGVLDQAVEPLADRVADAWVFGPFVPDFPAPISLATSFRGRLSICVCAARISSDQVAELAEEWKSVLAQGQEPRAIRL
jgi:NRPS condensation-like uncharacterized protein